MSEFEGEIRQCLDYANALREDPRLWTYFLENNEYTPEQYEVIFFIFDKTYEERTGIDPNIYAYDILFGLARGEFASLDGDDVVRFLEQKFSGNQTV